MLVVLSMLGLPSAPYCARVASMLSLLSTLSRGRPASLPAPTLPMLAKSPESRQLSMLVRPIPAACTAWPGAGPADAGQLLACSSSSSW